MADRKDLTILVSKISKDWLGLESVAGSQEEATVSTEKLVKLKRIPNGPLCIDMTRDLYGNKLTKLERQDFRQKIEKMCQQCSEPDAAQAGLAATAE